jgi:hypothetical protein
MRYSFEKVIDGLSKYINNNNLYSNMNDWQEMIARLAVGRVITNQSKIKDTLVNNAFIRSFDIMDEFGMVDVDSLSEELKREIARKEKFTVTIPIIGKLTFTPSDVDVLRNTITEESVCNAVD